MLFVCYVGVVYCFVLLSSCLTVLLVRCFGLFVDVLFWCVGLLWRCCIVDVLYCCFVALLWCCVVVCLFACLRDCLFGCL